MAHGVEVCIHDSDYLGITIENEDWGPIIIICLYSKSLGQWHSYLQVLIKQLQSTQII